MDLALELHSQTAESTGEVRAAAVREHLASSGNTGSPQRLWKSYAVRMSRNDTECEDTWTCLIFSQASPVFCFVQARLTSIVVPGLFRVLDFDQSGDIGTHEFIRGALLLLATVQGGAGMNHAAAAMSMFNA